MSSSRTVKGLIRKYKGILSGTKHQLKDSHQYYGTDDGTPKPSEIPAWLETGC